MCLRGARGGIDSIDWIEGAAGPRFDFWNFFDARLCCGRSGNDPIHYTAGVISHWFVRRDARRGSRRRHLETRAPVHALAHAATLPSGPPSVCLPAGLTRAKDVQAQQIGTPCMSVCLSVCLLMVPFIIDAAVRGRRA